MNDGLFVPGAWQCQKCDFRLMKNILSATTGDVHADTSTPENCANCDVPLWRVTWEADCREAWQHLEEEMEKTRRLTKVLKEIAYWRRDAHAHDDDCGHFRRSFGGGDVAQIERIARAAIDPL
ncbi:hypothetical protein [uncultured Roseobacter sp.]|uniref:hypothetical protein n=1 Tax=uncultured Roseobacter sp. TaxID=114847 RepID=UPI002607CD3D|nr:hypothetical protein [uncultured Roseobacter sp.]